MIVVDRTAAKSTTEIQNTKRDINEATQNKKELLCNVLEVFLDTEHLQLFQF